MAPKAESRGTKAQVGEAMNAAATLTVSEPAKAGTTSTSLPFTPTWSPVLKLPSGEAIARLRQSAEGMEKLKLFLEKRELQIKRMKFDPLNHGWKATSVEAPEGGGFVDSKRPPNDWPGLTEAGRRSWRPVWRDADRLLERYREILALGGNRAMKTEYAGDRIVRKLQQPGKIAWVLGTSHETLKRDQMKLIWRYLPAAWKTQKKTSIARITYNAKDGFADSAFVAPNGSECWFKNYKQDRDTIEGGQVDIWWGDELIPVDWVTTLRGRTVDRRGEGIVTFTPIHGLNPTAADYLTAAEILDWIECELLQEQVCWPKGKPGQIPYIAESMGGDRAVIWFQSKWNPFIDYEELVRRWKPRGAPNILIRLHGVTERSAGNAFPRFGKHNVIAHEHVPKEGTNYHLIDFAWDRNWFMLWVRAWECAGKKRMVVYREWPDYQTYGEWVLPSETPDGDRGPAQETLGWSVNEIKRTIFTLEGWAASAGALPAGAGGPLTWSPGKEEIYRRIGDSRSGNAKALAQEGEGNRSLLMMLENEEGGLPAMYVEPAVGGGKEMLITEGVNMINEWLEYDDNRPIDAGNEPILYVSERCQNLIACLKIWSGRGGSKGAAKDPIDMLRTAAFMNVEYVPPGELIVTGGMGH